MVLGSLTEKSNKHKRQSGPGQSLDQGTGLVSGLWSLVGFWVRFWLWSSISFSVWVSFQDPDQFSDQGPARFLDQVVPSGSWWFWMNSSINLLTFIGGETSETAAKTAAEQVGRHVHAHVHMHTHMHTPL